MGQKIETSQKWENSYSDIKLMKKITEAQIKQIFSSLPQNPRIVASGNSAIPEYLLNILDKEIPQYKLHMLNAPKGIPDREGITYETAFVGSGMRNSERLDYIPCRLSMVPILFKSHLVPDVVILHTSALRHGTLSLGIEVNILPAAIEAARKNPASLQSIQTVSEAGLLILKV